VTALYTLRAWSRGKLHRKNPTQSMRDRASHYKIPPEDPGIGWNAEQHNGGIAEQVATRFQLTSKERYLRKYRDMVGLRNGMPGDPSLNGDDLLEQLQEIWEGMDEPTREDLRQSNMAEPVRLKKRQEAYV